MNRFGTYGIVGITSIAVIATIDAAFGLGGSALIADICRTILDEDAADVSMAGMPMEVKPVPLIALSLSGSLAAVAMLYYEQRRAAAGLSKPTELEQTIVVSAMLMAAASHRTISRAEFLATYQSVTGGILDPELVDYLYAQSRSIEIEPTFCVPGKPDSLVRRRALAAAFILGCVARVPNEATSVMIHRLACELGATDEDVSSATTAVNNWRGEPASGVSILALRWGQRLSLKPSSGEVPA